MPGAPPRMLPPGPPPECGGPTGKDCAEMMPGAPPHMNVMLPYPWMSVTTYFNT